MSNKILGQCPVCKSKLHVTEMKCEKCGTVIKGDFELSIFDYLSDSHKRFISVFLKNGGNIKLVEKELGISYPTVKKILEEINFYLGNTFNSDTVEEDDSRKSILQDLKDGKIDFDKAEIRLKHIGETI
ncbi:MAG: DUF2089 domain-containing protein [Bacilli bacterium]|nr:DUF2089 domain-containing protein [Bacilli bacterium]